MNNIDVNFLDLFKSIRGNWGYGIDKRGEKLIEIIPETSLSENLKTYFIDHFKTMINAWKARGKDGSGFDGRSWARDCYISYGNLIDGYEGKDLNWVKPDLEQSNPDLFKHQNKLNQLEKDCNGWFDKEFYEKYTIYDLIN